MSKGGGRARTFVFRDSATDTWGWRCNACPVGTYRGYMNKAHAASECREHEGRAIHQIMTTYVAWQKAKNAETERWVVRVLETLFGPAEHWGPRIPRPESWDDEISERNLRTNAQVRAPRRHPVNMP